MFKKLFTVSILILFGAFVVQAQGLPEVWTADFGTWTVEDGVLKMVAEDDTDPKHAWVEQDFGESYTVQADVRIVDWANGEDMSRAGVGVRIQERDEEVHAYNLLFHESEGQAQFLNDKRGWGPAQSIPWSVGAWYTLTLSLDGHMITGNIKPINSGSPGWDVPGWDASSPQDGTSGLPEPGSPGLAGNSNLGEVWYDNFKVIVDGEVAFEEDFNDTSSAPHWELMK